MVVVDSSALIPLARVGRLDLVRAAFDDIHIPEGVTEEVLVEGKRGTVTLEAFLEAVTVHDTADGVADVADLEGIARTDAAVVLLAADRDEPLLANDRALIEVARSHGVDAWWVTTLLLSRRKDGELPAEAATDVLYDLVDEGTNLDPKVYARIQRKFRDIGE